MPAGGFIPRDPTAEVRTRRALGQITDILNSLILSGDIVLNGPGEWGLNPAIRAAGQPVVIFGDEGGGAGDPGPPGDRGPAGPAGPAGADGALSSAVPLYAPDLPPSSPHANDDEFDDGALGGAWTDWDVGGVMAYTEGDYGAKLTHAGTASDSFAGIFRTVAAGDFTLITKLSIGGIGNDFTAAGILLADDLTANPSTADFRFFGVVYRTTNAHHVQIYTFTGYNTFAGTLLDTEFLGAVSLYLRVRRVGTTLFYDYSPDGIGWVQAYTETEAYTIVRAGLCTNGSGNAGGLPTVAYFRFWRQTASQAVDQPILGGFTGTQGATGPIGPVGPTGDVGESGADGVPGERGPSGPTGNTGPTGPQGLLGPLAMLYPEDGEGGERGPVGERGPIGPTGPTGATGPAASTPPVFFPDSFDEPFPQPPGVPLPLAGGTVPGGRLTLTSGLPVTTGDVTGATTVYYVPFLHNKIDLWDGGSWVTVAYSQVTQALGTITSGRPYDVFGYLSGRTLATEILAWTNDTTRATGISLQDGRYAKTGDKTRLYLGTFYTTSATTTEDSAAKRFLWNAYNRVSRRLVVVDTTDSWTYGTAAWRYANNSAANRVEYVCGLDSGPVTATAVGNGSCTSSQAFSFGVGVDSNTANSAQVRFEASGAVVSAVHSYTYAAYAGAPAGVGFHYVAWVEYCRAPTPTVYGDIGTVTIQSGLTAHVEG